MSKKMRFAMLNCYLQAGHRETAEVEAGMRAVEAAARLGVQAKVFAKSEDLLTFDPDFVVAMSYQDAKLTCFPTYVALNTPAPWMKDIVRMRRNLISFDGYWTLSPGVVRFMDQIYGQLDKARFHAFSAFSVGQRQFSPFDPSSAWAAYIGTNWDGKRHGDLFLELSKFRTAKCYGKRERWMYLPEHMFGGEVPFDGFSALRMYNNAGIGLCLNHPDFDRDGIATSRVFEIPASSALMITGQNDLVRKIFGAAALYVDADVPAERVAQQVSDHVEWVRSHPRQSLEMAEEGNRIFNERLAMEVLLDNALKMHARASKAFGFRDSSEHSSNTTNPHGGVDGLSLTIVVSVDSDNAPWLASCLSSIASQTAPPEKIIVVNSGIDTALTEISKLHFPKSQLQVLHAKSPQQNSDARRSLSVAQPFIATEWVCCISASELLYRNHLFALKESVRMHQRKHGRMPQLVHSGMAELSETENLDELMKDPYHMPGRAERMRLVEFGRLMETPLLASQTARFAMRMDMVRRKTRGGWLRRVLNTGPPNLLSKIHDANAATFTGAVTLVTRTLSKSSAMLAAPASRESLD